MNEKSTFPGSSFHSSLLLQLFSQIRLSAQPCAAYSTGRHTIWTSHIMEQGGIVGCSFFRNAVRCHEGREHSYQQHHRTALVLGSIFEIKTSLEVKIHFISPLWKNTFAWFSMKLKFRSQDSHSPSSNGIFTSGRLSTAGFRVRHANSRSRQFSNVIRRRTGCFLIKHLI